LISYPVGVASVVTRIIEAGEGDDVIVLVHGAASRADRWIHNVSRLAAQGLHVYALDLPGHGFATKDPSATHSSPSYADFVCGLLERIPRRRLVLVGTSIGAHVVAMVACQVPTAGLVLVGAAGLVRLGDSVTAPMAERISDTRKDAVARKLTRLALAGSGEMVDEEWRINNSPGAAECLARLGGYIRDALDDDLVDVTETACRNVLLIWGEDDNSIPVEVGRRAQQQIAHAQLEVIRGAGHVPYWEQADSFHQVLDPWLASVLAS